MHAESFERFWMETVSKSLGYQRHVNREISPQKETLRENKCTVAGLTHNVRANLAKRLELETAIVELTDTPLRPSKRNTLALNNFAHASKPLLRVSGLDDCVVWSPRRSLPKSA